MREQMITDVLNSAHHAGQIAKNIVWVPVVYEKQFLEKVLEIQQTGSSLIA
jgi:hypothetical protein